MLEGVNQGGSLIDVRYDVGAPIGTLDLSQFVSHPSGAHAVSVVQLDPEFWELHMSGTTTSDQLLTFNGPAPGFLAPQTIGI